MNEKTIKINSCHQCPFFDFDPQLDPKKCGKKWCEKMGKELKFEDEDNMPIPDDCPL